MGRFVRPVSRARRRRSELDILGAGANSGDQGARPAAIGASVGNSASSDRKSPHALRSTSSERTRASHVTVLVTGHDGYIGSVAAPMLREAGHDVTGFPTLRKDAREITTDQPEGYDGMEPNSPDRYEEGFCRRKVVL